MTLGCSASEAMLARFMGGLNKEIQTILEYKDYNNITRLFYLACKAEREVQDRQALARINFSAGRPSSWTPPASSTSTAPSPPSGATSNHDTRKQAQPPLSAKSTPAGPAQSSSSSMASTGHTSDIICHRCKGRGHFARECKSQRVMIATEDGGYESAMMRRLWLLLHMKNTVEMILIMRRNTWLLKMLTGMNV